MRWKYYACWPNGKKGGKIWEELWSHCWAGTGWVVSGWGLVVGVNMTQSAERVVARKTRQHFIWAAFSPRGERRDTLKAPTLSYGGSTSDATALTWNSSGFPLSYTGLEIIQGASGRKAEQRRQHRGQGIPSGGKESAIQPYSTLPAQSHSDMNHLAGISGRR